MCRSRAPSRHKDSFHLPAGHGWQLPVTDARDSRWEARAVRRWGGHRQSGHQGSGGAVRRQPQPPHTKRASRAQALQPSDLGVSTRPSQQEASEPPSFPLSPTLHLLTSQSPPQPVLLTAPCGAPSGTFKQQDLRSLWMASSLSGQWQPHHDPPKRTRGTTPSPNAPPLPWARSLAWRQRQVLSLEVCTRAPRDTTRQST